MTKRDLVEIARKSVAEVTGDLEVAAIIAAKAQAAARIAWACDQLIACVGTSLNRLQQQRRWLG